MKILVACEESQRVCIAFRELGHEAYSCDIIDCSGGHPEWHIKRDVIPLLNGYTEFYTCDGMYHHIDGKWDMIIAFPPCTHLCVSGARWFDKKRKDGRQLEALQFFSEFLNADCEKIAIENPIGIISGDYVKKWFPFMSEVGIPCEPKQIIQPYEFGHPTRKATCLWLKGLPKLIPTEIVEPEIIEYKCKNGKIARFGKGIGQAISADGKKKYAFDDPMTAKIRSKTFPGIAKTMAEQWGGESE